MEAPRVTDDKMRLWISSSTAGNHRSPERAPTMSEPRTRTGRLLADRHSPLCAAFVGDGICPDPEGTNPIGAGACDIALTVLAIEDEAAAAERERLTPWIEHQPECDGPVYPCTCGLAEAYPEVGAYSLVARPDG
jgi:hypothetical protein